jgi:DNA-binding transcriptional ArsR family regulator
MTIAEDTTNYTDENSILRAYFEATRRVRAETKDFPVGILITFLSVALWGDDKGGKEPFTLQELAERTGQSPTTVSQHLRYLGDYYRYGHEGLGLVDTKIYQRNRRQKVAYLTPKGKALADQLTYIMGKGDPGI